jgi:hypothetical protein
LHGILAAGGSHLLLAESEDLIRTVVAIAVWIRLRFTDDD